MKILVIDDEEPALLSLKKELNKVFPDDRIYAYDSAHAVREFLESEKPRTEGPDFAFMDIDLKHCSGLDMAEYIRELYPECRFFFCTSSDKYALEAFRICAAGYLIKPVTADAIRHVLKCLGMLKTGKKKVYIRTFGNFDLFLDDKIVKFSRSKAKELLAYLVDRRGSGVTTPEAYSILWEDETYTSSSKDKVQHAKKDLRDTLACYGISDILVNSRNLMALDADKVNCDYYDYLAGSPKAANYYNGEYMSQYSWAEHTVGMLENRHWQI